MCNDHRLLAKPGEMTPTWLFSQTGLRLRCFNLPSYYLWNVCQFDDFHTMHFCLSDQNKFIKQTFSIFSFLQFDDYHTMHFNLS